MLQNQPKTQKVIFFSLKFDITERDIPSFNEKKQLLDVSSPSSSSNAAKATPPTKRRRVPITIVEPPADPSTAASSSTSAVGPETLLTPVSSRPLSTAPAVQPSDSRPAGFLKTPQSSSPSFKDVKEARDSARKAGGGIFRRDGTHTIFGDRNPKDDNSETVRSGPSVVHQQTQDATTANTTNGKTVQTGSRDEAIDLPFFDDSKKYTMTLFSFKKQWDKSKAPKDRWALLNVRSNDSFHQCLG